MGQPPHTYPPHMVGGMPQGPPQDEYAGLLTRQDRDWLLKIQMIQLHPTDDPYTDDYYYTVGLCVTGGTVGAFRLQHCNAAF